MVIYMGKDKKNFYLNTKIVIIILIFMIISLLSIYSSQKLLSSSYNNLYIKQLIWYVIGFIIMWIIYKSKHTFIYDHSFTLYNR
jgi:cell division protein FtsW (lipid II flippase)